MGDCRSFDGDVESDLISILETVGDGFLSGVNAHLNSVRRDGFDAGAVCGFGKPEYADRRIRQLRHPCVARKRDIHDMRYLGCQAVVD